MDIMDIGHFGQFTVCRQDGEGSHNDIRRCCKDIRRCHKEVHHPCKEIFRCCKEKFLCCHGWRGVVRRRAVVKVCVGILCEGMACLKAQKWNTLNLWEIQRMSGAKYADLGVKFAGALLLPLGEEPGEEVGLVEGGVPAAVSAAVELVQTYVGALGLQCGVGLA